MRDDPEDSIQSIQLEPTSRCNLHCTTCLKPSYIRSWQEHDMDDALFMRIVAQMNSIKPAVHLQGWGESLLHHKLFFYINALKKEGITVTFSSNGTTLTTDYAEQIITNGVDGITFSMAGTGPQSQDPLRGSESFVRLEESVKLMVAAKKKNFAQKPAIAISYLLTPETVKDLPEAVAWCGRNGADALVCVAMTQVASLSQLPLRFLIKKDDARKYRWLRIRANLQAFFRGVRLEMKPFHPVLTPICSKDPIHSLFISSRGDVAPCVFLCPPTESGIDWEYCGRKQTRFPLVFGNLTELTLQEIWEGQPYRAFRESWKKRVAYYNQELGRVSYSIAGAAQLEKAVENIEKYFSAHPVPKACCLCGKQDGL